MVRTEVPPITDVELVAHEFRAQHPLPRTRSLPAWRTGSAVHLGIPGLAVPFGADVSVEHAATIPPVAASAPAPTAPFSSERRLQAASAIRTSPSCQEPGQCPEIYPLGVYCSNIPEHQAHSTYVRREVTQHDQSDLGHRTPSVDGDNQRETHRCSRAVGVRRRPCPWGRVDPYGPSCLRRQEFVSPDPVYGCRTGARSGQVVAWLAQQGIEATNVAGGTQLWSQQGYPIETPSRPEGWPEP